MVGHKSTIKKGTSTTYRRKNSTSSCTSFFFTKVFFHKFIFIYLYFRIPRRLMHYIGLPRGGGVTNTCIQTRLHVPVVYSSSEENKVSTQTSIIIHVDAMLCRHFVLAYSTFLFEVLSSCIYSIRTGNSVQPCILPGRYPLTEKAIDSHAYSCRHRLIGSIPRGPRRNLT